MLGGSFHQWKPAAFNSKMESDKENERKWRKMQLLKAGNSNNIETLLLFPWNQGASNCCREARAEVDKGCEWSRVSISTTLSSFDVPPSSSESAGHHAIHSWFAGILQRHRGPAWFHRHNYMSWVNSCRWRRAALGALRGCCQDAGPESRLLIRAECSIQGELRKADRQRQMYCGIGRKHENEKRTNRDGESRGKNQTGNKRGGDMKMCYGERHCYSKNVKRGDAEKLGEERK